MNTTQMQLGGFIIAEPTTAVTDLILTILCIFIFLWLSRYNSHCNSIRPWRSFFLLMGLSCLFGSIVHGLRNYQSETYHYNFWMAMNLISGIAVYFAQMATIKSNFKASRFRTVLLSVPNIQLAIYLVLIFSFRDFSMVKLQIAAGMVPIMFINFYDYFRGVKGGAWIAGGIAVASLSSIVHSLKLSLSIWFNFNDISHVLLMCSFSMIFYGVAVRMIDMRGAETEAGN